MNLERRPLLLLALLLAAGMTRAENPIPTPWPAARYEAISQRSPFALATVVEAPVAPRASFAANWYVGGVGRIGEADFVTIKSRDASIQFSLFGREPNAEHGVTLAEVVWSDAVGKSTVTIRKGQETARLEFNEAEVRATSPVPAPPRPSLPGASASPTSVRAATPPKQTGLMVLQREAEQIRLKQQGASGTGR